MLTATYRPERQFSPRHISALLDHVRKWMARKGHALRYVWVGEMQRRGALHYHVLILLPKGLTLPKPDKQGWWMHGSTRIEWARHAIGYMAKYASKGEQGPKFPKGVRIHGCGGLTGHQLAEARYWRRPGWLRELTDIGDTVRRQIGGGWLDLETGEHHQSPWRVIFDGGQRWLIRDH